MRRLSASIGILLSLLAPAAAQQFYVSGLGGIPIQSMQLWGGGLVAHIDRPSTGVEFAAPDGSGGYANGSDAIWHQIINSVSFATAACDSPAFANPGSCFGMYPTTGTSQLFQGGSNAAPVEMCGSPKDSTRAFMFYQGYVFRSDNVSIASPDTITWINTTQLAGGGFTKTTDNSNANFRFNGRFIGCDPNNKDHLFLGTQANGVWETKDGGSTFAAISTSDIPLSTNTTNYIISFDPASGVNGSGLTNGICIYTNGVTAGVYCSSIGGGAGTWTLQSGGPATMQHMTFAPTGGVLWAVDGSASGSPQSGNLLKLSVIGGSWSTVLTTVSKARWVAFNPLTPTQGVVMTTGGNLIVSTDSGATWPNTYNFMSLAGGDSPWLSTIAADLGPVAYSVEFDPIHNGGLEASIGQGTWTTTLPSGSFTWTSHNKGVMHPVGFSLLAASGGNIITGAQDIAGCSFSIFALPSTSCHPLAPVKSLAFASGIAKSPNFIWEKVSPNLAGGADFSGYSPLADGVRTNFVPFNRWNAAVANGKLSSSAGSVQIDLSGSGQTTSALTVYSAGTGSVICTIATAFTGAGNVFNIGPNQTACYHVTSIASSTVFVIDATYSSALVSPTYTGSYILYDPTFAGSNWSSMLNVTSVQDDGSGLIQVTFMDTGGSKLVNSVVDLSGVSMTGGSGTPVNGRWIASNKTNTTRSISLTGSSSTGIGTYSSGGTLRVFPEPGGSITAASDTNIATAPSNGGTPRCSTDGGKTWSDITNSATNVASTTVNGALSAGAVSIVVADGTKLHNNASIWIPMDDGRLMFATTGTISGNTVPFATVPGSSPSVTYTVPAERSVADGAAVYTGTGWQNSAFLTSQVITTDTVVPNTFFIVNTNAGLIKWTNCGSTTVVNSDVPATNTWQTGGGSNATLIAVPGQAGHLFYTAGPQGVTTGVSATGLWRTCNGNSNSAVTMVRISGTFGPLRVGFGAAKPGSNYPSIYMYGWYDAGNVEANSVFGLWESTDDPNGGNSGTSATCTGTGNAGTFHKVLDWPSAFAGGPKWMVLPTAISGVPGIYGSVIIQSGDGPFYMTVNFLLNRDINPANDHTPMFLNKAA